MKRGLTRIQGPDQSASTLTTATSAAMNIDLIALGRGSLGCSSLAPLTLDHQNLRRPALGCNNLIADPVSAAAS